MKWMIGIVSALGISVLSIGLALVVVGSDSSIAGHDENVSVSASNGLSTAINVHGDWSIDVINPDGTLAESRDFTNALAVAGKISLVKLLTGEIAAGNWAIETIGAQRPSPSRFVENSDTEGLGSGVGTGGLLIVTSGNDIGISISYTVEEGGTINVVNTNLSRCSFSEGRCSKLSKQVFTQTQLPHPVEVVKGQTVNILVKLTFGS